jgi:hypothetical protein
MNSFNLGKFAAIKTAMFAVLAAGVLAASPAYASFQIADDVSLGFKFFADVTHSEDDADSGFHLKRSYVTLKAKVDSRTKLRLTLDQRSEDQADGKGGVLVKYAYVDYMLDGNSYARVGLLNTPYVGFAEAKLWGYRHVVSTFADYWKAQTSADLGASVAGALGDGLLEYQFSALNGEGYGNKVDGTGFAAAGRLNANLGKLMVGGFFHEERSRNGQTVRDYDPSRRGMFVGYNDGNYRLVAQYLTADDGAAATTFVDGVGFNIQGQARLSADGKWKLFGRYDEMDRKDDGNEDRFWLLGFSTTGKNGLTFSPNIRVEANNNAAPQTIVALNFQLKL